jgi:hypothetical protein
VLARTAPIVRLKGVFHGVGPLVGQMAARGTAGSEVHEFVRSHGACLEDRESPRTGNRSRNIMNRRRRDDVTGAYPAVRPPGNRSPQDGRTPPGSRAPETTPAHWASAPANARMRPWRARGHESQHLLPVPSGGCSVRSRLQRPTAPVRSVIRQAERLRVGGAGDLPHRLRLCEQRGSRRYPHLWTLLWTRRWGAPMLLR